MRLTDTRPCAISFRLGTIMALTGIDVQTSMIAADLFALRLINRDDDLFDFKFVD